MKTTTSSFNDQIENQIMSIETYITESKKLLNSTENENKVIAVYNSELDEFAKHLHRLSKGEAKQFTYKELERYHNIFLDGKNIKAFFKFSSQFPTLDLKVIIFWINYILNGELEMIAKNDIKVLSEALSMVVNAVNNDFCRQRYERLYHKDDPLEWFSGMIGNIDYPFGLDKDKYTSLRERYDIVLKGLTPKQ